MELCCIYLFMCLFLWVQTRYIKKKSCESNLSARSMSMPVGRMWLSTMEMEVNLASKHKGEWGLRKAKLSCILTRFKWLSAESVFTHCHSKGFEHFYVFAFLVKCQAVGSLLQIPWYISKEQVYVNWEIIFIFSGNDSTESLSDYFQSKFFPDFLTPFDIVSLIPLSLIPLNNNCLFQLGSR